MRKPIVLCALLLAACAPLSISGPFVSDTEPQAAGTIPATYYPTVTPIPTWTPPPLPTFTLAPPATPTVAPTAAPTLEPAQLSANIPEPQPLPTSVLLTVALNKAPILPTLAPTAVPLALAPTPGPLVASAPRVAAAAVAPGCPAASSAAFDLVPIEGPFYKNNALTDENADLRLSILGYVPSDEPPSLVDYSGAADLDAPKLHGLFEPNRMPLFLRVYQRLDWFWNESAPPPFGSRGGVNNDWLVSVIDLASTAGESIHIPERNAAIWGSGVTAIVLFASENELTLGYTRSDGVGNGYVVHLLNLCVDSNLIRLYRAQLQAGRRASGLLPGLRNNQPVGVALSDWITVAIRDHAAFLDPRSRKDWWQGMP